MTKPIAFLTFLVCLISGCQTADPAAQFVARVNARPEGDRPKTWDETRQLMARAVPAPGQPAPDFTLPTLDGGKMLTRTRFQDGRPLVLIFGSFT